ncbi:MAG: hypothetical protein AAF517_09025 [Planctomycetota bacterium]
MSVLATFTALALCLSASPAWADAPDSKAPAKEKPKPSSPKSPVSKNPAKPTQPKGFPYQLSRAYRYDWTLENKKVGDFVLSFSSEKDVDGKTIYVMKSRRKTDHQGASLHSNAQTYFLGSGEPVRYREESEFQKLKRRGRQDVNIRFSGGKAEQVIINNGRKDRAAESTGNCPKGSLLFATGALDHWLILSTTLNRKKPSLVQIYYSEFGATTPIRFDPKARETVQIGKRKIATQKFDFVYTAYKDKGSIWIDDQGRLIKYTSGPTVFQLSR